jgi:CDP-diacylglycerol---glycerol-3-phosphate 3-phosphatidyltransferase
MKAIPNCISVSRIIFSLVLLFVKPLSVVFYVIYIICGFTDIVDGFIARKTGTTSNLGVRIDSMGDMVMVGVLSLFPILLPYVHTTVLMNIICVLASISAIEELIIQLTSNQLQLNKQSIFEK